MPRRAARSRRALALALAAADAVVGWLYVIGLPFLVWDVPSTGPVSYLLVAGALAGTFLAGGYRLRRGRAARVSALGAAGGLAAAWIILKYLSKKASIRALSPPASQGMVGLALLLALWVVLSRAAVAWALQRAEARARILLIGSPTVAASVADRLAEGGQQHELVWFDPALPLDAPPPAPSRAGPFPLAALDAHMQGAVRAVVLATPADTLPQRTVADLIHYRILNVPVLTPSQLIEDVQERIPLSVDDYGWFLHDEQLHGGTSLWYASGKRAIDILGALLGLSLALPVLLLLAALVKATSRGPVLYRQVRVGRWKRPFTLLKLRTMRLDAEADGAARWASANDPRVTPLGRFLRRTRLDELPQLWNVLLGDMALVGPRPERPEFTAELEQLIPYYDLRHLVKPGVTGWAQVCFPYGSSVEDAIAKLEYDVYYIKFASLTFDARILLRTVGVVLGGKGT